MLLKIKSYSFIAVLISGVFSLSGCYKVNQKADPDNLDQELGVEYAPQMYHSEPYDPMSQITDTTAGVQYWPFNYLGEDKHHGEWYNTNHYNPHNMNLRQPAENTIKYSKKGHSIPYTVPAEEFDMADQLPDPEFKEKDAIQGEILYGRYCSHCHGKELDGKGPISKKGFAGIANLKSRTMQGRTASYIFHVITMGKNNMRPHAAQVSVEDRWKIAAYIKNLHSKGN